MLSRNIQLNRDIINIINRDSKFDELSEYKV